MNDIKYFILVVTLIFRFVFSQCDSAFTYFNSIPGSVNILAGDSCFYDQDLEALNDLISLNQLQYDSALDLGTQTWLSGRLKILVAGNYGNSTGVNDTIYTLPESIGSWTSLSGLYLEWNRIAVLPDSFNMLTELRSLYISNNILRSIIEDIDSLSHLTYLDLGYNEIDSLPSSLCNLNELQYLWLFNNNLTTLPECICSMSIDWSSDDSAWFPYFAIGGNSLCENVPDCIANSENFNISLDQFYYSFQIEAQQECDNVIIDDVSVIFPNSLKIDNPYPNPFNPTTSFEVRLLKNEELTIAVYDIKGFLVDIIFNSHASEGLYKFNWNASEFSSGIYFIELKTLKDRLFKKVILTK
ncbi:MAG: T9SS type A sorting domain-containing protein [Candidatus Neomarinimicrobiota bacterium]|nr:T9SS type A sorting domain-containing protein [Candidatus Neomarinimicrobiota bacterium]